MSTVVIGVDNPGLERQYRIRCLIDIHGVGLIHTNERHIYILQAAHFRNIFSVSGKIDKFSPEVQDISITSSFGMS